MGEEENDVKYPKESKQKVLIRMMAPHNEPVFLLASEFNVSDKTLYAWHRHALQTGEVVSGDGRNAEQWSGDLKFAAVLGTVGLAQAELGEYCRAKGLYPEQIAAWREVCKSAFSYVKSSAQSKATKADQQRIRELKRDLHRKERALAETAAPLVLRKNCGHLGGRRGKMISTQNRRNAVTLIDEAVTSGARLFKACAELAINLRKVVG